MFYKLDLIDIQKVNNIIRTGSETSPVSVSSACNVVTGSKSNPPGLCLLSSPSSSEILFDTLFGPCFKFFLGVLFPLTFDDRDLIIKGFYISKHRGYISEQAICYSHLDRLFAFFRTTRRLLSLLTRSKLQKNNNE